MVIDKCCCIEIDERFDKAMKSIRSRAELFIKKITKNNSYKLGGGNPYIEVSSLFKPKEIDYLFVLESPPSQGRFFMYLPSINKKGQISGGFHNHQSSIIIEKIFPNTYISNEDEYIKMLNKLKKKKIFVTYLIHEPFNAKVCLYQQLLIKERLDKKMKEIKKMGNKNPNMKIIIRVSSKRKYEDDLDYYGTDSEFYESENDQIIVCHGERNFYNLSIKPTILGL